MGHCMGEIYEGYMLDNRHQKPEKTVNHCNSMKQQLIRDCLVEGVKDSAALQKRDCPILKKSIDIGRGAETTII